MPVSGFPDPEKHRICGRCGQWFEPWEGSLLPPPKAGPLAQIGRTLAGVEGFGLGERFFCHACQAKSRRGHRTGCLLAMAIALLLFLLFALLLPAFFPPRG